MDLKQARRNRNEYGENGCHGLACSPAVILKELSVILVFSQYRTDEVMEQATVSEMTAQQLEPLFDSISALCEFLQGNPKGGRGKPSPQIPPLRHTLPDILNTMKAMP